MLAWGESNERQRGWCNPSLGDIRKVFPAAIWRRSRQIAAGKNGFARMTWVHGLLARSSQSSPQANIFHCFAVVVRSDPSQHRCAGLSSRASKLRCVRNHLSQTLSKSWQIAARTSPGLLTNKSWLRLPAADRSQIHCGWKPQPPRSGAVQLRQRADPHVDPSSLAGLATVHCSICESVA